MEGKMKKIKIFKIIQCDFANWMTNYKMYVVLILLAYFLTNNFDTVFDFARSSRCRVAPWLLPFCFSHPFMRIVIFSCVVFLFSNAPFMTSLQVLFLSRTGKKQWYIAQILYLMICSVLLTLFLACYPLLRHFPMVVANGNWGKVLKTMIYRHGVVHPVMSVVITRYSVADTMKYTVAVCILLVFFIGMVIFLCNVLFDKQLVGVLAACFFVMLEAFEYLSNIKAVKWISPLSWITISSMAYGRDVTVPSAGFAITCLVIVDVMLVIATYVVSQKRDITFTNH